MGAATPSHPQPRPLRLIRRSQSTVRARGPELWPPLGSIVPLPVLDSRSLPGHLPVLYFFPPLPAEPKTRGTPQAQDAADGSERDGERGPRARRAAGLIRSLELALALYAPLAGRLVWAGRVQGERRMAILCNNAGGLLVEAQCDGSMRSALGDNLRDAQRLPPGLTCAPAPALLASVQDPLLTVQLTSFSCGGVVLGVSFHHFVADGAGFFNFMAAWAALARSCGGLAGEPTGTPGGSPMQWGPTPTTSPEAPLRSAGSASSASSEGGPSSPGASLGAQRPSHERGVLAAREGPVESASSPARPVLRWPLGALAAAACQWGFGPAAAFARAVVSLMCLLLQCTRAPAVSSACFHLSAEQLRSLKARTLRRPSSQGEAPRADSSHALAAKLSPPPTASQAAPWASTDDVLCALLWQVMTAARGLGASQHAGSLVSFRRAVDIRSRLNPPLPKAYFGNAVLGAPKEHLRMPAGQLLGMPTAELAYQLRAQLSEIDEAYCRDFCSMAAPATALEAVISPTVGLGTVVSSWMKFDLYLDFGLGVPEHVCVAYGDKPKFVAGMTVLQPSRDPGGVDITVVLPASQAEEMEQLLSACLSEGWPPAAG